MSRASKLTILIFVGFVALLIFLLTKRSAPVPGPVTLAIQSYTNARAVVILTNLTRSRLSYTLKVKHKTLSEWPKYATGVQLVNYPDQYGTLGPNEVSMLSVPVMVYVPPYPWRLSLFSYNSSQSRNRIQITAHLWLLKLHLRKLALKLFGDGKPRVVQFSSPQMEQAEK
jgi:hypothetical protein